MPRYHVRIGPRLSPSVYGARGEPGNEATPHTHTCPSHTHLPPKLDIKVVFLPEDPLVGLHVNSSDRRMVADLLRNGTVPTILIHQFVCLTQQRVERLAMSVEVGGCEGGGCVSVECGSRGRMREESV